MAAVGLKVWTRTHGYGTKPYHVTTTLEEVPGHVEKALDSFSSLEQRFTIQLYDPQFYDQPLIYEKWNGRLKPRWLRQQIERARHLIANPEENLLPWSHERRRAHTKKMREARRG